MRLRLLGPLELVTDDRSLDVGGPRQRTTLAMLALNANRVTPIEQLIDAVWSDSPPLTARGQIQICISALRKLFTDGGQSDAIKTFPSGYLLETSASELDSEEFTALVGAARKQADEGRLATAATTLRTALALWRGPALAGIDSDPVRRGAALLEAGRLTALEERVRLDLALGRNEIAGELAALIDEHPLRERLYGYLMLALYRAGRQAEALEVRRRVRTVLVGELGIEPGPELQDLERAILNRDPALDLPVVASWSPGAPEVAPAPDEPLAPQQLPAAIADFTGRQEHVDAIREILAGESDGPHASPAMRIVAISGKGGVGKSSLAIRVAHELVDHFPDGHLYGDCQGVGKDVGHLLVRFLRALGVSGSAVPEDVVEQAEMYRSKLAGKRLLVVLDDVTTERQVLPLLPGSSSCAVLVTSRMRLSGLPGAHRVDVDVFDTDRSIELLAKVVGRKRVRAEPDATADLVRLCGGLPLALRIAGARLASRPHWRVADLVRRLRDEARRLDEFSHRGLEIRSNIGLTYLGLPAQEQRLFRLLAVLGTTDFPGWVAAALLDTGLDEADEVVESLVDARLLDTVAFPGERVRYRLHDLVRVYARERLHETEPPAARRAALGRVLGGWLALADEAHRREYGGDYTVLRSAATRWQPPGGGPITEMLNSVDWWDGQRSAFVWAIREAADAGFDELCWGLALRLTTLFEVKGYFDLWRETSEVALAAVEHADNRVGTAAMLYSIGTLHMFQKRLGEAERCFDAALEIFDAAGDIHGRALVLRNAALVDSLQSNTGPMLARYDEGLRLMRAVGDRMGEAQILRSVATFWIDEGDIARATPLLEEALGICRQVKCLRGEAQVVYQFANLHMRAGHVDQARQALHRVLLIVRDIGDRIGETYALHALGVVRYHEGRLSSAEATLMNALTLARRVGERLVEGKSLHALGQVCMARGSSTAAVAHLHEATELFEQLGSALWQAKCAILLAEARISVGDAGRAADDLSHATTLLARIHSNEATQLLETIQGAAASLAADSP